MARKTIEWIDIPEELRKGQLKEPYFRRIRSYQSERDDEDPGMDLESILNASNTDIEK